MNNLLDAAIKYSEAGRSVIPCNKESKSPVIKQWKPYQLKIAEPDKLKQWFSSPENGRCLAVICGKVSGNLEVLDFDCQGELIKPFSEQVEEKAPGLLSQLALAQTQNNGFHIPFCCPEIKTPGSQKLSQRGLKVSGPGEHPYKGKKFTARQYGDDWYIVVDLIETRGEGGYFLAPPSPGYEILHGNLAELNNITPAERQILIDTALSLNEWIEPCAIQRGYKPNENGSMLPGQDYDERGNFEAVLEKHGWQKLDRTGKTTDGTLTEYWRRPGKDKGHSATVINGRTFYCFSSSGQPFERFTGYSPFAVYALLEHNGNFTDAASALSKQGYGEKPKQGKQYDTNSISMDDLRQYVEFSLTPGEHFKVGEICQGLACYKKEQKQNIYKYISRLCNEGVLKKDNYKHGGYRRVVKSSAYNLAGELKEDADFNVKLPLDLENFINIKPDQLLQVSGRYDAGKSSFVFHTMAENYEKHKIIHIISDEWSLNAIKERMDILGIPRPHPNIESIPMEPGFEDLIPPGPCIVLIDYIRADQNPYQTDAQIQRVLHNLKGGIAIYAAQKHPGLDRPVGGQFAVHATHHIIMLDRWKELYTCKIFRTKSKKNMEGYFKTFKLSDNFRIYPCMDNWKQGQIKWEKDPPPGSNNVKNNNKTLETDKADKADKEDRTDNDDKKGVRKGGGVHPYIEIEKERKRKEPKEKERKEVAPSSYGNSSQSLFANFSKKTVSTEEKEAEDIPEEGVAF